MRNQRLLNFQISTRGAGSLKLQEEREAASTSELEWQTKIDEDSGYVTRK